MAKPKLTPEEAGTLAESVLWHIMHDPAEVARFVALVHALAYTSDDTARENMLIAIEGKLAPFMPSFGEMVKADVSNALLAIRKQTESATA